MKDRTGSKSKEEEAHCVGINESYERAWKVPPAPPTVGLNANRTGGSLLLLFFLLRTRTMRECMAAEML